MRQPAGQKRVTLFDPFRLKVMCKCGVGIEPPPGQATGRLDKKLGKDVFLAEKVNGIIELISNTGLSSPHAPRLII